MATAEEEAPTYAQLAIALAVLGIERKEYAGLPIPIENLELVIESKNPYFDAFEKFNLTSNKSPKDENDDVEVINSWRSGVLNARVSIYRERCPDGSWSKSKSFVEKYMTTVEDAQSITSQLNVIGAARAWLLKAEFNAMDKLGSLLSDHMFHTYMLTGSFIETSKRSNLIYMFRRLRPTIAMRGYGPHLPYLSGKFGANNQNALVARVALCLHPVGYYKHSGAGVLTPTDDVISHLLLMRGDEVMFWRRAQQHPIGSVAAMV